MYMYWNVWMMWINDLMEDDIYYCLMRFFVDQKNLRNLDFQLYIIGEE
jgi:hypothetical protein